MGVPKFEIGLGRDGRVGLGLLVVAGDAEEDRKLRAFLEWGVCVVLLTIPGPFVCTPEIYYDEVVRARGGTAGVSVIPS